VLFVRVLSSDFSLVSQSVSELASHVFLFLFPLPLPPLLLLHFNAIVKLQTRDSKRAAAEYVPRCKKARTRTTTLTLPPRSILEITGIVVTSRDRSEGVEAEDAMALASEAGDGEEGISLSSRAIVRNVSKMLWKQSWRRRRRMCYISRPFSPRWWLFTCPCLLRHWRAVAGVNKAAVAHWVQLWLAIY
jgi:hypothetical protein